MRQLLLLLIVLLQITYAHAQKLQPGAVSVDFEVNGTALTMRVPPGLNAITDPDSLRAFPYPENQNLYFVMKPKSGHESRYVAVGSRPELDARDISNRTFAALGKSFSQDVDSRTLKERIESFDSLVDKWRAKKGQPGFQAARTLEAKASDDILIMTAVVLNEDGSELINCVRMQHVKNRVVVIAVSSRLSTKADIAWVVATSNRLEGTIR